MADNIFMQEYIHNTFLDTLVVLCTVHVWESFFFKDIYLKKYLTSGRNVLFILAANNLSYAIKDTQSHIYSK